MNKITTKEIMINRNGKPLFAAVIMGHDDGRELSYVFVENGDIKFSSSWLSNIVPYELGNESHRLAKEIFTIGLQAAVKTKIYELKQLESILKDIHLDDCLGNVLIDNTKLLLDINNNFNNKTKQVIDQFQAGAQQIVDISTETVKKVVNNSEETIKNVVQETIVDTMSPIAVRKEVRKNTKKTSKDDPVAMPNMPEKEIK